MKEKIKHKKYSYRSFLTMTVITAMCISFILGSFMTAQLYEDEGNEGKWVEIFKWSGQATDIDPGQGVSGVCNVFIVNHQTHTFYDSDVATNIFEEFDGTPALGEELEGETPFNDPADICLYVQIDDSGYNSSSVDWEVGLVKCYMNCSDLSISSQVMDKSVDFFDQDGTTDAKINFFLQDADGGEDGAGFTLGQGEKVTVDDFTVYVYE